MPIFTIETPSGQRIKIEAPDEATAIRGAQEYQASQAPAPQPANQQEALPYGQPPEGMVMNPETGQMEDLRSPANPNIPQGGANAAMMGAGQGVGFGLLDEAVAGASTLAGGDYNLNLERMREGERRATEDNPAAYYSGLITGGVVGGAGLASSGASMGANAITRGQGLGRAAMGSAVDGTVMGAFHGFGSGEGADGRMQSAATGAVGGGVLGGAAPYAMAGVGAAARPFVSPIMSRLRPQNYANRALGDGLRRSGMTVDDITNSLTSAGVDGQDMFNVADAMGNSGQRMLSTVARSPNDMRQRVVEALTGRQMGQGDRLSQFLAEGFDATDTAAQRTASLTNTRNTAATANYNAARQGAGAVDPSRAIQAADDFLMPGASRVMNPGNGIADDSIEAAVRRARSYLTDGNSVITDFSAAFRSKQELDAMIEGAKPAVQRQLIPIRNALDEALESASPNYAMARDTYRQQSNAIDAVDKGRAAASSRVRSSDSIQRFNTMSPDEQNAFRAGYVDPMIARVESGAMTPTTNKARALISPKTGEEFPAFAAPGRGDQMGNRIGREQRMFETANAALGGSRTADNLADAAEMSQFDPEVLTGILSGSPIRSVLTSIGRRLANEAGGMSPRVIERIAEALMETDPQAAREFLEAASQRTAQGDQRRAITNAIMGNLGASASGRLSSP